MNCTKCQNTGWLCEEHEGKRQGHHIRDGEFCNGAGMPCTCTAFPHKKLKTEQPRDFWVSIYDTVLNELPKDLDFPEDWTHVREVVESPTDKQIKLEGQRYISPGEDQQWDSQINKALLDTWEAGAHWAIARLTGDSK